MGGYVEVRETPNSIYVKSPGLNVVGKIFKVHGKLFVATGQVYPEPLTDRNEAIRKCLVNMARVAQRKGAIRGYDRNG